MRKNRGAVKALRLTFKYVAGLEKQLLDFLNNFAADQFILFLIDKRLDSFR